MIGWIIAAVVYVVCGVLAYGLSLSYFQREYPTLADEYLACDIRDAWRAFWFGPMALIGLLVFLWQGGKSSRGLMWRRRPGDPL